MSTRVASDRTAVLTTANQLTILRIIFVPVFIILLAYKEIGWALCTFVAAGVTDVLDGIIARRSLRAIDGRRLVPLLDFRHRQRFCPVRITSASSIIITSASLIFFSSVHN